MIPNIFIAYKHELEHMTCFNIQELEIVLFWV